MKRLRRVTEAEVIAEFLKNEFYTADFHNDREKYQRLVLCPDVASEAENAVRRALLFRRRGHMWRELPPDVEWWEVRLEPGDGERLQVLSRCHWRSIANGNFRLHEVVERVRSQAFPPKVQDFIDKIHSLSYRLREAEDNSAVLLIGVDERQPLTILEGNHRLTAAALAGPELLHTRFRVLCGFSPNMTRSCWYRNSLPNLAHYLKNRLVHLYDREAGLDAAVLRDLERAREGELGRACSGDVISDTKEFSPGG